MQTEDYSKNSDITDKASFIWSIANILRATYMPDHYGDVIIPMTIIRRFECSLQPTKERVINEHEKNNDLPAQYLYRLSGYQFYNTSHYTLAELCNDPNNIEANFREYISGFSKNVRDILNGLSLNNQIKTMNEGGVLHQIVKAFSELDLAPDKVDSIQMGYIFENLIGRFFQNVDAGQYYTGRDIIRMLVHVLLSEGCDDLRDPYKVITVCDQACGTGGMLSTAYSVLKEINPSANIQLFGQEIMPISWAVGMAEMLIKGQDANNFRLADTLKEDCFPNVKMRLVLENPPFGTSWSGASAKEGQEEAVRKESQRPNGRWISNLPSGGDAQLIFMQSAIDKMDDKLGRAAIIENGSPLFAGSTMQGESQIRRWMLEHDLIEAIIAMPTDLFYNTGIQTYAWILSKNKRQERRGKIQLIDASNIYHKLRKSLANKKNEFTSKDIKQIVKLYKDFDKADPELSKVYDNTEFIYREYTIMQPLQRSYSITSDSIDTMVASGALNSIYNESKVYELENSDKSLTSKDKKLLDKYYANKEQYNNILQRLHNNISEHKYNSPEEFEPVLTNILSGLDYDKKLLSKIASGLSKMDKHAKIQTKKNGDVIYDTSTKDIELVRFDDNIDDYMQREVLPHIPDAKYFDEDKIGAEIPFTRYFYKYKQPKPSDEIEQEFLDLEKSVNERVSKLFKEA